MSCEGRWSTSELVIGEGDQPRGVLLERSQRRRLVLVGVSSGLASKLGRMCRGGRFLRLSFFFVVGSLFYFWLMETVGFGSMFLLLGDGGVLGTGSRFRTDYTK
ncbi:hypothetical protein RJT34_13190 [Clitoria ternatea]|uniref:Transmembrane protein n=1 Tax=Clitoria ternatea TaxID=43366 RepID=A0AAN9JRN0_CLITE